MSKNATEQEFDIANYYISIGAQITNVFNLFYKLYNKDIFS